MILDCVLALFGYLVAVVKENEISQDRKIPHGTNPGWLYITENDQGSDRDGSQKPKDESPIDAEVAG